MEELAAIRRASGTTQVELAHRLGVGQAAVSKLEHQSDMLLSTLRGYLVALGADAQIIIRAGGQTMKYDLTAPRREK